MALRKIVPRIALILCILVPWLGLTQTAPAQAAIRIVSPEAGERLSTNFVTVRFELLEPGATPASSPNYLVRLDGREPVRTTDTEFTFSGLTAGTHTVMVELVDANGTPIAGTRTQVRFTVAPQPLPTETTPDHTDKVRQTSARREAVPVPAVLSWVEERGSQGERPGGSSPQRNEERLPRSSSALPLLSVIGLVTLLAGLLSAMRSR